MKQGWKQGVFVAFTIFALAGVTGVLAQQMAPRETASTQINGLEVSIEYGRPDLGNREVTELMKNLPQDRMWRAGSEQVTTLYTEGPIMIGNKMIPAGKYSLYLHLPESGDYALAVNKVLGQKLKTIYAQAPPNLADEPWPHMNYEEEIGDQEVARIPLDKKTQDQKVDRFTIDFDSSGSGALLKMTWGKELWTVPVTAAKGEGSMPEGSHHR